MKSFSEFLSEYIRRIGISDAELARSLGVRRQTIFRWREGLTARPRHRIDVMRLAEKLRLTNEERDTLLLAAGFSPESDKIVAEQAGPDADPATDEAKPPSKGQMVPSASPPTSVEVADSVTVSEPIRAEPAGHPQRGPGAILNKKYLAIGLAGLVILFLILGLGGLRPPEPVDDIPPDNRGGPTVMSATVSINQTPTVKPPRPDETVILVTHFKNYAGPGFNVRDRLRTALEDEIKSAKLQNIRVEPWSEEIGLSRYAIQAGQAVGASLIIFGEYDSGRVLAQFVYPAAEQRFKDEGWIRELGDLQELSPTINKALPDQIRPVALLILGQILITEELYESARLALEQARDALLRDANADKKTLATIDLYRGLAYAHGQEPQYDKAIEAYSMALQSNPGLILARFNRGIAYHARQAQDDLELALEDVNAVLRRSPGWAAAYNNRAAILIDLDLAANEAQIAADLTRALDIDPALASAYVNRALLSYVAGEQFGIWKLDIDHALEIEPAHAKALNMMCWGHAINRLAEFGFHFCEDAVAIDPSPVIRDSRGLAHALLGNVDEAIADFEVYVTWLEERGRKNEAEVRRGWIEALTKGANPFTDEVLAKLRNEPGPE